MTGQHRQGCEQNDLAVGWALHALEPDEESAFAAHLQTCPECTRRVGETESVGAALALGAEQVDPPARLREAVLARAHASRDVSSTSVPRQGRTEVDPEPDAGVAVSSRESVDADHGSPQLPADAPVTLRGLVRSRGLLVMAGIALVAAVGLGWLGSALSAPPALTELAESPVRSSTLVDPDGEQVFGVVLANGDTASVVPVSMPPAPAGKAYWLWGLEGDLSVPLGKVSSGSGDVSDVADVGSADPGRFLEYAISTEAADADPDSPTTVVAASGTI